jgi:TolA-binding protein
MTTPVTPSDPQQTPATASSEESLRQAWGRYGSLVYIFLVVVAVGILAKGGWDYLNAQKELGIKKDFAECTTPDSYRTFIGNHPGHVLTGVAELIIANDAYSGGKFTDAVSGYTSAIADLPAGIAQSNAKMGLAMALAQSGKGSEAETSLRLLLNDPSQLKTTRCEAGYHIAELALADGRGSEVQKLAEQEMQIDPSSPFAERTFALRPPVTSSLTVPGVPSLTVPSKP